MASSGGSSRRASTEEAIVEAGIEPGASSEPMLVTTDSFDELEQELVTGIDDSIQASTSKQSKDSPVKRVPTVESLDKAASSDFDDVVS